VGAPRDQLQPNSDQPTRGRHSRPATNEARHSVRPIDSRSERSEGSNPQIEKKQYEHETTRDGSPGQNSQRRYIPHRHKTITVFIKQDTLVSPMTEPHRHFLNPNLVPTCRGEHRALMSSPPPQWPRAHLQHTLTALGQPAPCGAGLIAQPLPHYPNVKS
jgi:hypothetical protein